jgi:NAD(P) transhydrogenase subunit alpha
MKNIKQKQIEKISQVSKKSDIIISTALIPGKKAPILITKNMIEKMKPGSIVIDLAAIAGGNCELTKQDQNITTKNMVTVIGPTNILEEISEDASKLYARNLWNFLEILLKKDNNKIKIDIDSDDEIIKETLIIKQNQIMKKL